MKISLDWPARGAASVLVGLLWVHLAACCAAAPSDAITATNGRVTVGFDATDGRWIWLELNGATSEANCLAPGVPGPAVDVRVDGEWLVERHGATLLSHQLSPATPDGDAAISLTYGILRRSPPVAIPKRWIDQAPEPVVTAFPPPPYEFELTVTYRLPAGETRIIRSATLMRHAARDFFRSAGRRHDGFLFVLPGVAVGRSADCTVEVPGPMYTYAFVEAGAPYPELARRFTDCRSSPDRLPGIVGIENRPDHAALAAWIEGGREVATQTYLAGDGGRLSVLMHVLRGEWLRDTARIESDTQTILFAESFRAAQAAHRRAQQQSLPPSTTTPAWAREMVILEVAPGMYGGFNGLAGKLPFYREIGFNTLYLLPHWVGSYANSDPRAVEPSLGTSDDLRRLVARAHELGMRVLFDMVIHGFAADGPVARQHPEFFTRDANGRLETHFAWGSLNTDPANPSYRRWMEELVEHDIETYDIDGYRVDANSYKPSNWDPQATAAPWASSSTLPLYRAMYEAMQRKKKDVVLYSEMFGPAWHSVSNLAQDANWGVVTDLLQLFDDGQATAASYKAGMASLQASLPAGANRIRFCRNHDTCWFCPKHWRGYTARFLALDAIHALTGVPVVFAGDPHHPPTLEADARAVAHYRGVFALRRRFAECSRGELLLDAVSCDHPGVFTAIRRLDADASLVVVSLADEPCTAALAIDLPGWKVAGTTLVDPVGGGTHVLAGPTVTIQPGQTLVGRLVRVR